MAVGTVEASADGLAALARRLDDAGDALEVALRRLLPDLRLDCAAGAERGIADAVRWCRSSSADVRRRATIAAGDAFAADVWAAPRDEWPDLLAELVLRGDAVAVSGVAQQLGDGQLLALVRSLLPLVEARVAEQDTVPAARAALRPLWERVHALVGPAARDLYMGRSFSPAERSRLDELASLGRRLTLPPPKRKGNVFSAFLTGLVKGDFDDGYDSGGLELSRITGSLLSGIFMVGDVRDAAAAVRRRDWKGAGFNAFGMIPIIGDVAKGADGLNDARKALEGATDAARAADRAGGASNRVVRVGSEDVPVLAEVLDVAPADRLWRADPRQLQKKYDRHAGDFAHTTPSSPQAQRAFAQTLETHVRSKDVLVIKGNYHAQGDALFYVDPLTQMVVFTDLAGHFWSGWQLQPDQLERLLTDGFLW